MLLKPLICPCDHHSLEQIPHDMVAQSRNSYVDAEVHSPTLEELGKRMDEEGGNYQAYLESIIQNLCKEAKEKFKGWVTCSSIENTDLSYKKVITESKQHLLTSALQLVYGIKDFALTSVFMEIPWHVLKRLSQHRALCAP